LDRIAAHAAATQKKAAARAEEERAAAAYNRGASTATAGQFCFDDVLHSQLSLEKEFVRVRYALGREFGGWSAKLYHSLASSPSREGLKQPVKLKCEKELKRESGTHWRVCCSRDGT